MKYHGYKVDFYEQDASEVSVDHVLLCAPLSLDESRFGKYIWKKFSKRYPQFNLLSRRALDKLLDKLGEDIDLAHKEIEKGELRNAQDRLECYNCIGVGLYSISEMDEPMRIVNEFQSRNPKAGAYDCRYISHGVIYLGIWIDW